MAQRKTGEFSITSVGGEDVRAFVPFPLPPLNPPILLDERLARRLRLAEDALVRLELAVDMIPSLDWFLYAFVRKEAVLSSQIEGTQATLVDLLTFEAEPVAKEQGPPTDDLEDVCNYLDALGYSLEQVHSPKGLPISIRLLNETHRRLMRGVRGAEKQPGEIRRTQNWIGGSRPGNAMYVPPPPHLLADLLSDFEKYIHADDTLPPLVRAGILHVQFETIHPYLDGNGRIGRLLVTLLLQHWNLLTSPLLYLSLFFKRHRDEYYRRLTAVRTEGAWEEWLDFFLDGVATIADEAIEAARSLFTMVNTDRQGLLQQDDISVAALRLFESLPRHPIVNVASVMRIIGVTKPTASRAIGRLVEANVLTQSNGKKRDRLFMYREYLNILRAGTDLDRRMP